ncbi:ribonuclease HI [Nocardia jiangsuensis]|uniref:Ribonuclease HI n=1 Tax=Nocardia jiangsuensis TaxID=1691563 RepID=A0ABV8DPE1_9NOCA
MAARLRRFVRLLFAARDLPRRSPRPVPTPKPAPTRRHAAVILAAVCADGMARAVLVLAENADAETIVDTVFHEGEHCGAVTVDAFAHLQRIVVDRNLHAAVDIGDPAVREWFAGQRHSHLTLATGAERSGVRIAAEAALARHLEPESVAADVPAPVVIATDASARAGRRGVGVAYVTACGRWRQAYLPDTSAVAVGELEAILLALSDHPGRRVTVLTDSRSAIDWIEGRAVIRSQRVAKRVDAIRRLRTDDVEIHWVKAHSGHLLNEAADRLAVAARRNVTAEVPTAVRESIARNIVDEMLTNSDPACRDGRGSLLR